MRTNMKNINADFTCNNCGRYVSANTIVSGVVHRNHCPYCLRSRHVDLFEAGDRLCACKSLMAPVGLTLKRSQDKYASQRGGEVMLVHRCTYCDEIAINRIAADDDPAKILALIKKDGSGLQKIRNFCKDQGIYLLDSGDREPVLTGLFGKTGLEVYENNLITQTI